MWEWICIGTLKYHMANSMIAFDNIRTSPSRQIQLAKAWVQSFQNGGVNNSLDFISEV